MARMTGFIFQDKYLVRLEKLSDQEVGRLVRALATYHASGEVQELKGRECGYYDFIKADIDEIEQSYSNRCKTNKDNRSRSLTTVDDRERTSTIVDDGRQNININKNINNTTTAHAREESSFGSVELDPLVLKVQQELNGLTDTHYQALNDYRESLGDELVGYAIDLSVGNGVRNWNYVESILRGWVALNIKTIGEAKAEHEKRKQQKPYTQQKPKLLRAQDYEQREYNEAEMKKVLGVDDIFISDEEYMKRYGRPRPA